MHGVGRNASPTLSLGKDLGSETKLQASSARSLDFCRLLSLSLSLCSRLHINKYK